MTFYDGSLSNQIGTAKPLSGGTATSDAISSLVIGTHTIIADLRASPRTNPQPTATLTEVVNFVSTTTVSTSSSRSIFNDSVTFTAQVTGAGSTPTGTVTFVNANTGATLGSAGLDGNGVAQISTSDVAVGNTTIVATYSGDGTYRSSSGTTNQVVTAVPLLAIGSAAGGNGTVSVYDPRTGALLGQAPPFGVYAGGVKVAVGDINGDGYDDLVMMAGPGALNGHVIIVSGRDFSLLGSYTIGYPGELNLAVGDYNGDGLADVIVSTATDFDYIAVFSSSTQNVLATFSVFGGLRTGVTLATGDFNGDGKMDIIAGTATQLGGAVVLSGGTGQQLAVIPLPIPVNGVTVAAGDVNGDGKADIIFGIASLGTPIVAVFDAATQSLLGGFQAYPGTNYGVRVSTVDRNDDGKAEIVTTFDGPTNVGAYYDGTSFSLLDGFIQIVPGEPISPHGLNVGEFCLSRDRRPRGPDPWARNRTSPGRGYLRPARRGVRTSVQFAHAVCYSRSKSRQNLPRAASGRSRAWLRTWKLASGSASGCLAPMGPGKPPRLKSSKGCSTPPRARSRCWASDGMRTLRRFAARLAFPCKKRDWPTSSRCARPWRCSVPSTPPG